MKYAIIIPDGAADFSQDDLDGRSPLAHAATPFMDRIAEQGRIGTVQTTPQGMPTTSDVCCMSLLGYDPLTYHSGRAPLEAAAREIPLNDSDWVFRVNLISAKGQHMTDHSAGQISTPEATRLIEDLAAELLNDDAFRQIEFIAGVSYRHLMVDRSGRDYDTVTTTAPHDIPGEAIHRHLPRNGELGKILQQMIERSAALFENHDVNMTRRELGELPATHIWPWGPGRKTKLPPFEQVHGMRGAMITAVDLLRGMAHLMDWPNIEVPGMTSFHDTDYAATGRVACEVLDQYDLVCVHVEAPDEASHQGDLSTKIASLEQIDQHIVRPIYEKLSQTDRWRMLIMPDHYTLLETRTHDATAVPFVMAGTQVRSVLKKTFTEANADESDLHIAFGHELMEYFLKSALKAV